MCRPTCHHMRRHGSAPRVRSTLILPPPSPPPGPPPPTRPPQAHGRRYDPSSDPLPSDVVTQLLLPRYLERYGRLGLMGASPLKQGPRLGQQQSAGQAAGAGPTMWTPRGRHLLEQAGQLSATM